MKHCLKIMAGLIILLLTASFAMAQPSNGNHRVILDAGHGGTDNGVKISGKTYEKDFTLAVATQLKKELEQAGNIQVMLSRTGDRDLNLTERKTGFRHPIRMSSSAFT